MKKLNFVLNRYGFVWMKVPKTKEISIYSEHYMNTYNYHYKTYCESGTPCTITYDDVRLTVSIVENRFNRIIDLYTDSFGGIYMTLLYRKNSIDIKYKTNIGADEIFEKFTLPLKRNESVVIDLDKNIPYAIEIYVDFISAYRREREIA